MKNGSCLATLVSAACLSFLLPGSLPAANYDRVKAALTELRSANPALVEPLTLGKNDLNADILGVRIGLNTSGSEKVNHLIVGAHHGNETTSADLALTFANDLLAVLKNPQDPLYKKYAGYVFHIIPVLNVTGFNSNSREEKVLSGIPIDPNRDYPDACYATANFKLKSTELLAKYLRAQNIVGAATIHGYIGTFTYPWGTYALNTHTPDHDFFISAAQASVKFNKYEYGTHADVIYAAVGAFEDWAYNTLGAWTMLVELDRRANLANDSRMLLTYFSMLPATRSQNHQHGVCQSNLTAKELARSRP